MTDRAVLDRGHLECWQDTTAASRLSSATRPLSLYTRTTHPTTRHGHHSRHSSKLLPPLSPLPTPPPRPVVLHGWTPQLLPPPHASAASAKPSAGCSCVRGVAWRGVALRGAPELRAYAPLLWHPLAHRTTHPPKGAPAGRKVRAPLRGGITPQKGRKVPKTGEFGGVFGVKGGHGQPIRSHVEFRLPRGIARARRQQATSWRVTCTRSMVCHGSAEGGWLLMAQRPAQSAQRSTRTSPCGGRASLIAVQIQHNA